MKFVVEDIFIILNLSINK